MFGIYIPSIYSEHSIFRVYVPSINSEHGMFRVCIPSIYSEHNMFRVYIPTTSRQHPNRKFLCPIKVRDFFLQLHESRIRWAHYARAILFHHGISST